MCPSKDLYTHISGSQELARISMRFDKQMAIYSYIEYYTEIKKNEYLIHITWMNLKKKKNMNLDTKDCILCDAIQMKFKNS